MKKHTADPRILVLNRKKIVEEMEDKYGYLFCQHCKRSRGFYKLHVHHIVFRSEAPEHEELHSPVNLLICCNECHDLFHKEKSIREPYLQERNLREIFSKFLSDEA